MPFVFGEVDSREQAPWAYDATNDLQKAGLVYAAAAGLTTTVQGTYGAVAASGLTAALAILTVPTGKSGYITDFVAHANGPFTVELDFGGIGYYKLYTPTGGGEARLSLNSPWKVAAGTVISAIAQNNDTVARNLSILCSVVVL